MNSFRTSGQVLEFLNQENNCMNRYSLEQGVRNGGVVTFEIEAYGKMYPKNVTQKNFVWYVEDVIVNA